MSKLNAFKKLLKESIREVLHEEGLVGNVQIQENNYSQPVTKQYNEYVEKPSTGNVLLDLLHETRDDGGWRDMGTHSTTTNPQQFLQQNFGNNVKTGKVSDMLQSKPGTLDINNVDISIVPNFSEIASKMNL